MNGTIRFVSKEGVGSTFSFDLPLGISANEQKSTESVTEKNHSDLDQLKVLIVEDATINQMVIKKMLSKLHIEQVELATNGLEGVKMATSKKFDLILMDVQMPEMDGLEASEKILKFYNTHHQQPPVIFALTANAMKEDIEKCMAAGMSHFISKPFTQRALNQAIFQHLMASSRD